MFGAVWTRFADSSLAAGGGQLADSTIEVPMSMNNGATLDGSVIVGLWNDASRRHGFIVQDGVFHSYDVPSTTIRSTSRGRSPAPKRAALIGQVAATNQATGKSTSQRPRR